MNSRSSLKCALPPLCAFVAVGFMMVPKELQIHEIAKQTTTLRERGAQAEKPGRPKGRRSQSLVERLADSAGATKRPGAAAKVMSLIRDAANLGYPEVRSLEFELAKLAAPDLLAALAEVEALEIDVLRKSTLRRMIAEQLGETAPELAVHQLYRRDLDQRDPMEEYVSMAFSNWVKNDFEATMSWFDERMSAGDFTSSALDGKCTLQLSLMASLTRQMLSMDPAAAERRLANLPQDQRGDVLQARQFHASRLTPGEQVIYADIARRQLPGEQSRQLLADHAGHEGYTGYETLDEYIGRIHPTPEERMAIAPKVALSRKSTGEPGQMVSDLHEWLSDFTPGEATLGRIADHPELLDKVDGFLLMNGIPIHQMHHGSRRQSDRSIGNRVY